jgi:pilus assembly protein Flp/PilA
VTHHQKDADIMIAIASVIGKLRGDRKGVTALEYGVVAAALILAIAGVFSTFGTQLTTKFTAIVGSMKTGASE